MHSIVVANKSVIKKLSPIGKIVLFTCRAGGKQNYIACLIVCGTAQMYHKKIKVGYSIVCHKESQKWLGH